MLKSTRSRRAAATLLAGAATLALALTGCTSAVQQASQSATPVDGGTLTIAQSSDIQPSNVLAGRLGNSSWAANVFQTLTSFDANMKPEPLLATKWRFARDKMSMDITLRDDVTFQSGRKMTADDVKFSFEAAADPTYGSQVAYIAKSFTSIDVTSPTTLTIHFSKPTPNIFDFFEYAFILDKDTISGLANGSKVIGTGPFIFKSWSPGSSVTLVRNDKYWGKKPHLDEIDIAVITDSTAMLNAVRSNRSQIAIGMNPFDVTSMASNSSFSIVNISGSVYPLGLNVTDPVFKSKEARQAVNIAIDRKRIAKQIFGDAGIASDLFWDPTTPGYPKDLANYYPYDPSKARQMLTDAGVEGSKVTITVISLPQNTSVAEIVRNNLEAVGLKPTINVVETQTFGQNQITGNLGQVFMPLHGLNGLAPITLMNTLPSLRQGNPSQFWTSEYAALRQNLVRATTASAYADALHALSAYILDQAFTSVIVQAAGQNVVAKTAQAAHWTSRGYLEAASAFVTNK